MAIRDTYAVIADGDQLNDGYFNGITTSIERNVATLFTDRYFPAAATTSSSTTPFNSKYLIFPATTTANWASTTGLTSRRNEFFATTGSITAQTEPMNVGSVSVVGALFDAEVYRVYDECNDSSVNGSLWTTSTTGTGTHTITEDTTELTVTSNTGSIQSGTAAALSNDLSAENGIMLGLALSTQTSGSASIQLSDGSNHVSLVSAPFNNAVYSYAVIRWNTTTNKAYVNLGNSISIVDISSLSGSIRLRLFTTGNNSNVSVADVWGVRTLRSSYSTAPVYQVSADGSNWTTIINGSAAPVTAGSVVSARVTATLAANEGIVIRKAQVLPL